MNHTKPFPARLYRAALLAVLFGALPSWSVAAEPRESRWFLSMRLNDWYSGSLRRQDIRGRSDNPYLRSRSLGIELGRRLRGRRWEGSYAFVHDFAASVGFDDGTGRNRTLNPDGSRRSITALEGTLWRNFGNGSWIFGIGPGATFGYERVALDFREIGVEEKRMAGLEVGVSMALEWCFLDRMWARMEVDNLLRAPWVTHGRLSSPLAETSVWSSGLRSRFSLSVSRGFRNGTSIELIYRQGVQLELDEPRGHILDLGHSVPTAWTMAHNDCWIVRFGIRP